MICSGADGDGMGEGETEAAEMRGGEKSMVDS